MLVLRRKIGESIVMDGATRVTVLAVKGKRVKIGVSAPPHIRVARGELLRGMRGKKAREQEHGTVLLYRFLQERYADQTAMIGEEDNDENRRHSPAEDLATLESALNTLSEPWVQNVFGASRIDLLFDVLQVFSEILKTLGRTKTSTLSPVLRSGQHQDRVVQACDEARDASEERSTP